MLRMLCVTAHPDDEAGMFGGALRLSADRGVETHVICMTPGQAAAHRGTARSDQDLGQLRRAEFAEACRILKVSHGEVLDYVDGQLEAVDFRRAVADLTRRIRRIRPQVVLTMGPEGAVTGHPDHAMAGVFASMAFQWAARTDRFPEQLEQGVPPHRAQKLYYTAALSSLPGRQPIAPPPVTAAIDVRESWQAKIDAFHAHQTQAPLFPIFDSNIGKSGPQETYHLAATTKPGMAEMETDLFAGVEDDS